MEVGIMNNELDVTELKAGEGEHTIQGGTIIIDY